jgi:hypothetical protein
MWGTRDASKMLDRRIAECRTQGKHLNVGQEDGKILDEREQNT